MLYDTGIHFSVRKHDGRLQKDLPEIRDTTHPPETTSVESRAMVLPPSQRRGGAVQKLDGWGKDEGKV